MIETLGVCGGSYWKIACDALFSADISQIRRAHADI